MKSNHFRLWGVLFSALVLGMQILPLQAQDAARTAYNNGINAGKKGDLDAAITYLSQAIELNPQFTDAYYPVHRTATDHQTLLRSNLALKKALCWERDFS